MKIDGTFYVERVLHRWKIAALNPLGHVVQARYVIINIKIMIWNLN